MREWMNTTNGRFRRQLLTSVSAFALLGSVHAQGEANADDDTDRPLVWIELGGQMERQTGQGDPYAPPFVANYPSSEAYKTSPQQLDKPPLFSIGGEGALTFQPDGSDWLFSASVRYGRANSSKFINKLGPKHQIHNVLLYASYPSPTLYPYRAQIRCCHSTISTPSNAEFINGDIAHHDSHLILDFQAGKDVGLGFLGRNSTATLSAGVRFAQFMAQSSVSLHARPDFGSFDDTPHFIRVFYPQYPQIYYEGVRYHTFAGTSETSRNFHGVGPEISWNSSVALLGNAQGGMFTFDWGANAAVLFGRRKAQGQHHESGHYVSHYPPRSYYYTPAHFNRSHTVTVPNLGGFAGVSFKFPNAKVSLGYRGDFFFGAMDTGWDTEKTKTVGFYGPFVAISVGLGG
jgi:hypothetical protein